MSFYIVPKLKFFTLLTALFEALDAPARNTWNLDIDYDQIEEEVQLELYGVATNKRIYFTYEVEDDLNNCIMVKAYHWLQNGPHTIVRLRYSMFEEDQHMENVLELLGKYAIQFICQEGPLDVVPAIFGATLTTKEWLSPEPEFPPKTRTPVTEHLLELKRTLPFD